MPRNLDSLATLFLRRDKSRASQAAFTTVYDLVRTDPKETWQFILTAIIHCRDDKDLAYLAAGPLEDLLKLHGPRFIERTEKEARRNRKFLHALTGVWLPKDSPVFPRWYAIMESNGYVRGKRKGL